MCGLPEERTRRSELGESAPVHDGDAVGERGDHGEVVAHIHGRNAVGGAQVTDGLEHVRLRGDVEARGRLVEDDHAGPVGEGHRERHPLLLSTGQLVWVAAQEDLVARQHHFVERLRDACTSLFVGGAEAVRRQRLVELRLDLQRRVQRGSGILRNVRDELAAQLLTLEHREHEDVAALDPDLASRDARATARVAENGQSDRGLAGA